MTDIPTPDDLPGCWLCGDTDAATGRTDVMHHLRVVHPAMYSDVTDGGTVMVPVLRLPMRVDKPRPSWAMRLLGTRRARWS